MIFVAMLGRLAANQDGIFCIGYTEATKHGKQALWNLRQLIIPQQRQQRQKPRRAMRILATG